LTPGSLSGLDMTASLVYEVTLSVNRAVLDEFDAWLEQHVREMLELPGFLSAETFETGTDSPDRAGRTVHYVLESEDALEAYLAGPAEEMCRAGELRFGDRLDARRRVLRPVDTPERVATSPEFCLNCQAQLQGQYCARCGQRARGRLISIWELVRDAVGDLFELDSRLWQTIIPLVLRPGKLTHEYLIGRRARFMPPFRTYLVLSIVFFLVAFFDPQQQFGILFEPEVEPQSAEERRRTAEEIRKEVLEDLAAEGIDVPASAGASGDDSLPDPPPTPDVEAEQEGGGVNVQVTPSGELDVNCDFGDFDSDAPAWFSRRVTKERLEEICNSIVADRGRSFTNQLLDNIPAALFILLPLMALVLKMLYPLSKRYYVEHLLFVLHFHAFFFLILTLEILFSRATTWLGLPELVRNLSVFVVSVYVPVYLYKAMRRVYEQGRAITLLKFLFLFLTYVIGLFLLLLFAAFYTAFSI
jgi:Protein of unknown function (DUF3667)/Domain of unknown function (DUF4286)